jgi:hypothetical protein
LLKETAKVSEPCPKLDPRLITLSDLTEQHIPFIADYWFNSPPGFIEAMGVDLLKLPEEPAFIKQLQSKCAENRKLPHSKLNALVILYHEEPVGFHTLNPLVESDFAIFHAHVFKSDMRSRGLGCYTYPMASKIFIERFGLKRLLYKTPQQNTSSIRVKDKLGIRFIGEEIVEFGILKAGTRARVYELTRDEADLLMRQIGFDLLATDVGWRLEKNREDSQFQLLTDSEHLLISAIVAKLQLSFEGRIEAHENARQLASDLFSAGAEFYARS